MDARQMTMLEVPAFLVLGLFAGTLFFVLLRWNTTLYIHGGSVALALVVQLVRFAAMGGVLVLTASQGALPLLLTALGLLLSRPIVVHYVAGGAA
jgi:F1-F0 ATPase (N-ATPase) AtpR subunit